MNVMLYRRARHFWLTSAWDWKHIFTKIFRKTMIFRPRERQHQKRMEPLEEYIILRLDRWICLNHENKSWTQFRHVLDGHRIGFHSTNGLLLTTNFAQALILIDWLIDWLNFFFIAHVRFNEVEDHAKWYLMTDISRLWCKLFFFKPRSPCESRASIGWSGQIQQKANTNRIVILSHLKNIRILHSLFLKLWKALFHEFRSIW